MPHLSFRLNEKLYLRDPQHTLLGRKIVRHGIEMIDRLGFEQFTFKKLAEEIDSTEASVYRYFDSKHKLLHYVVAWYWCWVEYHVDLAGAGLKTPEDQLHSAIRVITEEKKLDRHFEFANEEILHRLVVSELDKTFLNKTVHHDLQSGYFDGFQSLCERVAGLIEEINPAYRFSQSLASSLIMTSIRQQFLAHHLPALSSVAPHASRQQFHGQLNDFLQQLVFEAITPRTGTPQSTSITSPVEAPSTDLT